MSEWLADRRDALVDAAFIYVAVKWVLPFLISGLLFLCSSTWGLLALAEIVGIGSIFVCLALGLSLPPYRARPAGLHHFPMLSFPVATRSQGETTSE